MNPVTYPNFLRFLRMRNIPVLGTEMSFSVSYILVASVSGVFSQLSNLWNPGMYRTLFDILRFNTFATDLLDMEETEELRAMSISTYLNQHNYSQAFRDNYLIVSPFLKIRLITAYDCCDLVYSSKLMFLKFPCLNINSIHAQSSSASNFRSTTMAHY